MGRNKERHLTPTSGDFPSILSQMPGFLSLFNLDGYLVWTNKIVYGLDTSIIGAHSSTLIMEEDRPLWEAVFRRVLYGREASEYTVRVPVPAPPGWACVQGRMAPIFNGHSDIRYIGTVAQDATFREQANPLAPFVLSPLGQKVVACLLERGPLKGASIGRAVGELGSNGQASPRLRALLAQQLERNILEHDSDGYRVTAAFRGTATALRLV